MRGHDRLAEVEANDQAGRRFGGDSQVLAHATAGVENDLAIQISRREAGAAAKVARSSSVRMIRYRFHCKP